MERGISLNSSKFVFAQPEAKFAGFVLSSAGYCINPDLTSALSQFSTPQNLSQLRSFFGLTNQLATFTETIAKLLEPLRPLLSPKNDEFLWTEQHEAAFVAAKEALSSPPALAYYDMSRPLALHTDGSNLHGIGFVLKQKQPDGHWHAIQAGSRSLSDPESRYSAVELEMLAVSWAILKCRPFLAGLEHFDVITDHKPLIPLLNSKTLDQMDNPRLQQLRRKTMEFTFTAHWCPGKANAAPDALSRSPVSPPTPEDELAEEDAPGVSCMVAAVAASDSLSIHLDQVSAATQADSVLQQLSCTIRNSFPEYKYDLPERIRAYRHIRDQLSLDGNLIVYGCRLVIPRSMQRSVLQLLHESHQGINRTKARARQVVYWPGIDNDIQQTIQHCQSCQRDLPSHPQEPYVAHELPSRPFQVVHADLFYYAGQQFLVIVDALSNWPWVFCLGRSAVTRKIISAFCDVFCCSGVPDTLYSDNGPQFASREFSQFLARWQVDHVTSSPYYAQSNGRAEAAVKSVKKILKNSWNFQSQCVNQELWAAAMLQYRNTPSKSGRSPAVVLYGQPVQDMLPVHRRSFDPCWQVPTETAASIAEAKSLAAQE